MIIERPTDAEVHKSIQQWSSKDNYASHERGLTKLFTLTYPSNQDLDDVLIKVCSLNDLYGTNIFSPFKIAKHIISLQIDSRLQQEDLTVVNDIAKVIMSGNKMKLFYSFASKYCSHHKPDTYPIYDSFVAKMLIHFKKTDNFCMFKRDTLKVYPEYKEILLNFREYYGLTKYSLKDLDRYLWIRGKENFPRKYKKSTLEY